MMRFSGRSAIFRLPNFRPCAIVSFAVLLFSSAINSVFPHPLVEAPSQQESKISAAEQVFAEGQQLMAEGTVASQRKAIEKFAEAATLWHAVGDKRREAIALSLIGKIKDLLGEKPKALDYYNQTLALIRAVGDRLSEAATLNNIGLIY